MAQHDCLVIGAGPAGLSAATYLARYRRHVLCVESQPSRAALIPTSHNLAGYPAGISGEALLARLREQAAVHDVVPRQARVERLRVIDGGFAAVVAGELLHAARVILATGVVDQHPGFDGWQEATLAGAIRWCPICDGYDVMDQDIALLGPGKASIGHALFLRTYSRSVTLAVLPDSPGLDPASLAKLEAAGIELLVDPVVDVRGGDGGIELLLASGGRRRFDTLYPMQGCSVQNELARGVGATCDDNGDVVTDAHQATSVAGLYAVGDVVSALNQIGVAFGHAAIAATAVHRSLPRNLR